MFLPSTFYIILKLLKFIKEYNIIFVESWARSSTAEQPAHNRLVLGSNPGGPTIFYISLIIKPYTL